MRLLPFPAVGRLLARLPLSSARAPSAPADRVGWAVTTVARRLPLATCLAAALVGRAMLQRRRHVATLYIGVRTNGSRSAAFEAHAWVESGGSVVIGHLDNLDAYATLTTQRCS